MSAVANFLAIDLGASNGRVLHAAWDGARFGLDVVHRFPNGAVTVPGGLHWNVLGLWDEMKQGMARYAASGGPVPDGIGIDTWGVDFALLDRRGDLLANPVTYRDPRTNGIEEIIFRRVPRRDVFAITGIQFMQLNTLVQLCAMRHHGDRKLDQAARLLMIPDLFNYWMTGEQVAEYTDASTTQLFDAGERRWATGLMARFDLPTQLLPDIVLPTTTIGPLLPYVTDEVGWPSAPAVLTVGSHDTASAVAAVPGLDTQSIYLSSGTWSLMGVETGQPVINEQARAYNFTNEGGVEGTIRLLKNIIGLWMVQECRSQWQREGNEYDWETLAAMAGAAPPLRSLVDPDAPQFLNPPSMVDAVQDFCRKSGQPVPESVGEIIRCCLESLALRYRAVAASLDELMGHHHPTIRVVGGGCQNRLLNQFTADACQRTVVSGPAEATALGNTLVQAIATGHLANLAEGRAAIAASVTLETFEPNPGSAWDDAFARFEALATN